LQDETAVGNTSCDILVIWTSKYHSRCCQQQRHQHHSQSWWHGELL